MRPIVRSGNFGLFREIHDLRRSTSIAVLLRQSAGFDLSPHPLVLRLSRSSLSDHTFQLSSLEVGFIRLCLFEDSAKDK